MAKYIVLSISGFAMCLRFLKMIIGLRNLLLRDYWEEVRRLGQGGHHAPGATHKRAPKCLQNCKNVRLGGAKKVFCTGRVIRPLRPCLELRQIATLSLAPQHGSEQRSILTLGSLCYMRERDAVHINYCNTTLFLKVIGRMKKYL